MVISAILYTSIQSHLTPRPPLPPHVGQTFLQRSFWTLGSGPWRTRTTGPWRRTTTADLPRWVDVSGRSVMGHVSESGRMLTNQGRVGMDVFYYYWSLDELSGGWNVARTRTPPLAGGKSQPQFSEVASQDRVYFGCGQLFLTLFIFYFSSRN